MRCDAHPHRFSGRSSRYRVWASLLTQVHSLCSLPVQARVSSVQALHRVSPCTEAWVEDGHRRKREHNRPRRRLDLLDLHAPELSEPGMVYGMLGPSCHKLGEAWQITLLWQKPAPTVLRPQVASLVMALGPGTVAAELGGWRSRR